MQKHVNLVDLVKSFPTNIFLQNLASIQKRTSPIKFAHLAEKSEKGSISNLSTKARTATAGPKSPSRRRRQSPRRHRRIKRRSHSEGSTRNPGCRPCTPFRACSEAPRRKAPRAQHPHRRRPASCWFISPRLLNSLS